MALTLVLGGAASGKSAFAEGLLRDPARAYLATSRGDDAGMAAKIARHRAQRGPNWRLIEAPLAGPEDLPDAPLLFDCLTVWLANMLHAQRDWEAAAAALFDALAAREAVAVSNELGMGLVPMEPLSRRFRDAHGQMNQMAAARAHRVAFVAAGLPLWLKTPD